MNGTISQLVNTLSSEMDRKAIGTILTAGSNLDSSQMLSSAALAITAAGSMTVSTGASASYAVANGTLVKIAADTVLPALVGTVANAAFNIFCFYSDANGALTSAIGNAGSTLAAVTFPQLPQKQAMIGFIIINPTGTGNFVGGTTALDNATVIPNTAYINTVGSFDTSILVG